jgi:hypothetical protein
MSIIVSSAAPVWHAALAKAVPPLPAPYAAIPVGFARPGRNLRRRGLVALHGRWYPHSSQAATGSVIHSSRPVVQHRSVQTRQALIKLVKVDVY